MCGNHPNIIDGFSIVRVMERVWFFLRQFARLSVSTICTDGSRADGRGQESSGKHWQSSSRLCKFRENLNILDEFVFFFVRKNVQWDRNQQQPEAMWRCNFWFNLGKMFDSRWSWIFRGDHEKCEAFCCWMYPIFPYNSLGPFAALNLCNVSMCMFSSLCHQLAYH